MEVKTKAKAAILMEMEVGTKNEKGCRLLGLRSEVVREGVRLSEREFGWTGTDEGSSLINKVIQRHNQPEKQKNKGTNVQFFLPQILENGWQAWLVASMKA
ncbi:unnamed protein product [Lactuca virosa]|uniref:Uncharacterized protein n=1 Tax=Lactuca virosa TaxID=75947 RepID=A0AAU9P0Y7_9ASTR|nr:unnamed protein product [Lactuca virosa]